ncbi:MAG TPA: tetratricopeptide repeat protein [Myxococcaceae bacterium]|nr:tetratricopeptide repeat protein [Myxococcaceae bacterium]
MAGGAKPKAGAKIDRGEVLAAADQLRVKGKYAKAVAEYRKVLLLDPKDADVLAKIAPLLVKLKEREEALRDFRAAADAYIQRGFVDRAIALYVQATAAFPMEAQLWETLGRLHQERGRKAEGIKALMSGAARFKGKKGRPTALKFLRQALSYDVTHIEATIALARLLKANGEGGAARTLLDELAARIRGPAVKRIHSARLRLFPGLGSLWRWMRG